MIEQPESATVITGSHINVYRVMAIRQGLILKIDTGMRRTRISTLSVAQRDGITDKRTYRAALKDVNTWLLNRGVKPVWSRTYPNG